MAQPPPQPRRSRGVLRALMVLTGVVMLVLYAAFGFLLYRGLLYLWARRPDPETTAVVVVTTALVFGYFSYRVGVARILRGLDAREISPERAPGLYRRVDRLADELGIERPRVSVAHMEAPNALALGGPSEGDVVLDERLFRLLSADELEAIVAHELVHLDNRDGLVQTLGASLVQTVAGLFLLVLLPVAIVVGGIARALAYIRGEPLHRIEYATVRARRAVTGLAVVALFVFTLALRAHSRRREYAADDRAAELVDPLSMARALAKIEQATAARGLFSSLYIHGDEEGTLTRLLATHPPMDERIERLVERAETDRDARAVRIEVQ